MPNNNMAPDMNVDIPANDIENPQNSDQAFAASFSNMLLRNLGYYVVCEFLIGTTELEQKDGILYSVGNNFVALYQEEYDRYVVCDLFSLKFVTFYPVKTKPRYLISPEQRLPNPPTANGNTRYPAPGMSGMNNNSMSGISGMSSPGMQGQRPMARG